MHTPEIQKKLEILADAAKYDASCASSGSKRKTPKDSLGNTEGSGICHSYAPDGRCISLLKILLTNYCVFDCTYCINRASSNVARAKFSVDEVVWITLEFYRRNYIEGLFLSSGVIRSPDDTMEEMAEIARLLREEHRFGGYIHLKAVAGASKELIEKAGLWADRLSANIELPTQGELDHLAPAKKHIVIENSMSQMKSKIDEAISEKKKFKKAPQFAPAGQSTQMIVGATLSSDQNILFTSSKLYNTYRLRRVYYSAFSPIPKGDPRLPLAAPPLVREHRLYQADWLMRFYGFKVQEIVPAETPNLDLRIDPKLSWAIRNRGFFPIDINFASKAALLRIPGFGMRTVERILQIRKFHKVTMMDLVKLRVPLNRAKYFITTADSNPHVNSLDRSGLLKFIKPEPEQISLFETATQARTGEL